MAVKDHSLDGPIREAAKKEFMEKGFSRATLHDIAGSAGLTTGALYTRYKGKDDLFCSLIRPLFGKFKDISEPLTEMYLQAKEKKSLDMLLETLRREEKVYMDLLFDNYDECVLLFCRSAGSSMEPVIASMMEQKATATVEYLSEFGNLKADRDGLAIIISEQLHYYMKILQKGYSKDRAVACMKTVEDFLEAGWRSLFDDMRS